MKTGVQEVKKIIIIACIIASALIILDSMNAAHAVFMFFLAGIIPGTNIAINADRMLEVFAALIGFTLSRIANGLIQLALEHRTGATVSQTSVAQSSVA